MISGANEDENDRRRGVASIGAEVGGFATREGGAFTSVLPVPGIGIFAGKVGFGSATTASVGLRCRGAGRKTLCSCAACGEDHHLSLFRLD